MTVTEYMNLRCLCGLLRKEHVHSYADDLLPGEILSAIAGGRSAGAAAGLPRPTDLRVIGGAACTTFTWEMERELGGHLNAASVENHNCNPSEETWMTKDNWGDYGVAIAHCREDETGAFWVGNDEYSNRVNFCPWCGRQAPRPIEAIKEAEPNADR